MMDDDSAEELRKKLERLKQMKEKEHYSNEISGAPHGRDHEASNIRHDKTADYLNKIYVIVPIMLIIIILNVYLRSGMLQFQGFFEPDGFFHYSVVLQAIANHYIVPANSSLSGFPSHNAITEPSGLYYVTLVPYAILQYFSVSVYTTMRYIPLLFGVLDAIGAYFLVRHLAKNNMLGLLAMFFVSISSGDIARTSALVYRGDGFATIFVIIAILFFIKSASTKRNNYRYMFAFVSGLSLSIALFVWGGGIFGEVVYIFALLILLIYSFIKANEKMLYNCIVLSLALLFCYIAEQILVATSLLRYEPPLGSPGFFVFWIPLFLGSILTLFIIKKGNAVSRMFSKVTETWKSRLAFSVLVMLVLSLVILVAFHSYISSLAGTAIGTGSLETTIQELQRPTFSFIWSSFSWQIILGPLGLIMFLFYRAYLKGREGKGAHTMHANIAFIALFAYLIVTSYLQYSAIRYNSLVSVPLAIFSAYFIYIIISLAYRKMSSVHLIALVVLFFIIFYAIASLAHIVGTWLNIYSIFLFVLISLIYVMAVHKGKERQRLFIFLIFVGLFCLLIARNFTQTYTQSLSSGQADDINPLFLNAMTWIRTNTPTNSTFLAVWPDGSVIEGWGDRQSFTDSVAGQIVNRVYNFSRFLFTTNNSLDYLYTFNSPDYIVSRYFWYDELGGIAEEGNITNSSQYGYDEMTTLNIQKSANATYYLFNSSSYSVDLVASASSNNSTTFSAYLGQPGQNGVAPIKGIMIVNQTSGAYTSITSNMTNAQNLTFAMYVDDGKIGGGAVMGAKMAESNFFKLTYLCGTTFCPYNNQSGATLSLVFANNDTKIFKVNYTT